MRALGLALAVLLGSCVLSDEDLSGLPCPCAGADYTCDTTTSTCIRLVSGPFTIALSPASVTLPQGRTTSVSVDLVTKVAQTIAINATDLPAGVVSGAVQLSLAQPHGVLTLTSDISAEIGTTTANIVGKGPTGSVVTQALPLTITGQPGIVDGSFGTGGTIAVTVVPSPVFPALAIDGEDRILIVAESSSNYVITRLSPDGVLDPSFGTAGSTTVLSGSGQPALMPGPLAVQPDGKLLVGGGTNPASSPAFLSRFTEGVLDPTFGSGGNVAVDFGTTIVSVRGIVVQPDGRITVAVDAGPGDDTVHLGLARYMPDGTPDATFGTGGRVLTALSSDAESTFALLRLSDGRLVTAGSLITGTEASLLVRFTADGALDPTFADGGMLLGASMTRLDTLLETHAGALVAGGFVNGGAFVGGLGGFVSRYLDSGMLDPSFGTAGTAISISTQPKSSGVGVVLENADGSLAVLDAYLSELSSNGVADAQFGHVLPAAPFQLGGMAAQSTGRLVVLSTVFTSAIQLTRYWP